MSYASVHLDMPPSSNRMWRKGKHGIHPSAEYDAWKTAAGQEVMARRVQGLQFQEPVEVTIVAKQLHKLRDLDNIIKPCLDALQFGQLLANDNQVRCLFVRWSHGDDERVMQGREVRVEVRSMT